MARLRRVEQDFLIDFVDIGRGRGFVLLFSDATFSRFFAEELETDIDHPFYARRGASKGNRLWFFLEASDPSTMVRALNALWEYRADALMRQGQDDPISDARNRLDHIIKRIESDEPTSDRNQPPPLSQVIGRERYGVIRDQFAVLQGMAPQERGYAFEKFLKALFDVSQLKPKSAFRLKGEQIDGSFEHAGATYLLEAKWQSALTGARELRAFQATIEDRPIWTHGLFVGYWGFSEDGLIAFGRSRRIVCMDGGDLRDMLAAGTPFELVLQAKLRAAGETGLPFKRFGDLGL